MFYVRVVEESGLLACDCAIFVDQGSNSVYNRYTILKIMRSGCALFYFMNTGTLTLLIRNWF